MKKIMFALLLALLFIPTMSAQAAAPSREVRVYLYRDYADCVFLVSWANAAQEATVQIKDPDGNIMEATAQNAAFGKGHVSVPVGAAESGYWTVYVAGEDLGTIHVSGGSSHAATAYNAIQSFDATVNENSIDFKWTVLAEQDTINVSITASQGSSYGHYTVWNDYSASKNGSASVSTDAMQTGLYAFTLQVYDGNSQHTLSTDAPIYVKQQGAPAKVEDIKVGSINSEMFATWNIKSDSSYMVTLYDYDTLAVTETAWANSNFFSFDAQADRVKFSVQATDGSAYGEFDIYEIINSTPAGTVLFPEASTTRESYVTVTFDCPADVTAGVYLDGKLLLENAGAGDYNLNLSEGVHEIVAFVKDENGSMKTFTKSITVDKTPPVVNLNNEELIKTTSDSVVVNGSTEPNAIVAINGVEQELGTGSFMAKLALENGMNPITVAAYDMAGNKSVKTIAAERTGMLRIGWLIYIIPGIVLLLLAGWYIYLNKKPKEDSR
jgi:hypothetical protein